MCVRPLSTTLLQEFKLTGLTLILASPQPKPNSRDQVESGDRKVWLETSNVLHGTTAGNSQLQKQIRNIKVKTRRRNSETWIRSAARFRFQDLQDKRRDKEITPRQELRYYAMLTKPLMRALRSWFTSSCSVWSLPPIIIGPGSNGIHRARGCHVSF